MRAHTDGCGVQLYYDVANVLTTNSKPLRRQGNGTMLVAEGFTPAAWPDGSPGSANG